MAMLSFSTLVNVRVARNVWNRLDEMMITCCEDVGIRWHLLTLSDPVVFGFGRVSALGRWVTPVIPV